jgi:galactokinase
MSERVLLPPAAQKALEIFPIVMNDTCNYISQMGVVWAPGRVNLIGEHTDYNDGFVLPIAVNRVVAFAARARQDSTVRIWSSHFQEYAQFSLDGLPETFEQQNEVLPRWALYIMAVVAELMRIGVTLNGFDAVVNGDVPVGGGMISSAAIEIATTQACALFSKGQFTLGDQEATIKPIEVAALCQRAEHLASGVRSGILDQAASCLGRPGKAIQLDCRSLEYRYLPFDAHDLSLVVIDTSIRRELATSAYNERRRQCEEAVQILSKIIEQNEHENQSVNPIYTLRDITQEQLDRFGSQLPPVLQRRAGFVIAENARVLETAKLLEQGSIEEVGPLLWASHAGLRYDYEVSCFELDTLVDIVRHIPGVLGARMLGGGFGGCTINLVRNDAVESLKQIVNKEYLAQTGLHESVEICQAAGGPGMRWIS